LAVCLVERWVVVLAGDSVDQWVAAWVASMADPLVVWWVASWAVQLAGEMAD
jgi:hypothetical protein